MLKAFLALLAAGSIAVIPHTELKSSIPAAKSAVPTPTKVSLTFSEAIVFPGSTIVITKPDSTTVVETLVAKLTKDPATFEGAVTKPIAPGKYLIKWKTSSDDGHVVRGTIPFSVVVK